MWRCAGYIYNSTRPAEACGEGSRAGKLAERRDIPKGSVGYRLGRDLRLGFNVDQQRRDSLIDERRYEGLKYGVAVSFGQ